MKCPSCAALLDAPLPRCPNCKLTLQKLDIKFGLVPAHSRLLSDRTSTLELSEMRELRAALGLFHKKFPQILLSVFVTELQRGPVAEFGFWMANRARFTSADKLRGENCNLLLVIDLASKAASLTTGYGLERHVSEDVLQNALEALSNGRRGAGLAAGIRACIDSLTQQLRDLTSKSHTKKMEEIHARNAW